MPSSKIFYFCNRPLGELIVLILRLFLIKSLAAEVQDSESRAVWPLISVAIRVRGTA